MFYGNFKNINTINLSIIQLFGQKQLIGHPLKNKKPQS